MEKEYNGFRIKLQSLPEDRKEYVIIDTVTNSYRPAWNKNTPPDTARRRKVTDLDEIKRLLPPGAGFDMVYNPYTETTTMHSYRAPSGMEVIPDPYDYCLPVYLPDEGFLMFCNLAYQPTIFMMVNAYTGEDAWFDTDVFTSPGGSYRMVRLCFWNEEVNYLFQYRDADGRYRDLGPYIEIAYPGSYDRWLPFRDISWIDYNVLGAVDYYDRCFLITFTPSDKPLPAERLSPPVQPKPPVLFEMEVRDPLTIDYGMTDRQVTVGPHTFRFRKLPMVDFRHLHEYYAPRQIRPWGIEGIESIAAYLPEYTFRRLCDFDVIYEIRKGDEIRIIMGDDQGGPYTYFPSEGILTYSGGHASDQSYDLRTMEVEDFNPGYNIYSPDMRYRVTGMHDGQDDEHRRLQRLDPYTGRYGELATFEEIFQECARPNYSYASYFTDFFWIGNTVYFRVNDLHAFSLTMPGE